MVALAEIPQVLPRLKVSLVAPAHYSVFNVEPLFTAFRASGVDIEIVADEARLPKADALILAGSVGSLRRTVRALETCTNPPPVISWIAEPLPPVELCAWAEQLGLFLSPSRWRLTWGKPVLMTLSRPAFAIIARFGLKNAAGPVESKAIQFAINNLAWVYRGQRRGWLKRVGVTTRQRVEFLADRGIEAEFLPAGINASYGEVRGVTRDIDVLFIGRTKLPERRQRLNRIVDDLRQRGLTVEVRTSGTFGEKRTRLVNRAKIVLNINTYFWDTAWMRWYLATANGAAMASEPQSVPDPLRPGVDYLEAKGDALAAQIADLVADEPRRLAMVAACRDTLTQKMSTEASARRIAQILRELASA